MSLPPCIVRMSNCWCGSGLSAWDCLIVSRRAYHDGVFTRLLRPLCWIGWHSWGLRSIAFEAKADTTGTFLFCRHCHKGLVLISEPPFEHPDCMTVELAREQEEWLAEVAAEAWPRDEDDYLPAALGHLHLAGVGR